MDKADGNAFYLLRKLALHDLDLSIEGQAVAGSLCLLSSASNARFYLPSRLAFSTESI